MDLACQELAEGAPSMSNLPALERELDALRYEIDRLWWAICVELEPWRWN